MMRLPLVLALLLTAPLCWAERAVRAPEEAKDSFAMRFAPAHAEELVKVVESAKWFGVPAIAAFYRRSVIYADKPHNYGSEPHEYEIIGVLFVPVASGRYETVEIDSYGPQGSTAEISAVYFDPPRSKAAAVLVVNVAWHPRPGDLRSVCGYSRPSLHRLPKKLVRAKGYDCSL